MYHFAVTDADDLAGRSHTRRFWFDIKTPVSRPLAEIGFAGRQQQYLSSLDATLAALTKGKVGAQGVKVSASFISQTVFLALYSPRLPACCCQFALNFGACLFKLLLQAIGPVKKSGVYISKTAL